MSYASETFTIYSFKMMSAPSLTVVRSFPVHLSGRVCRAAFHTSRIVGSTAENRPYK